MERSLIISHKGVTFQGKNTVTIRGYTLLLFFVVNDNKLYYTPLHWLAAKLRAWVPSLGETYLEEVSLSQPITPTVVSPDISVYTYADVAASIVDTTKSDR